MIILQKKKVNYFKVLFEIVFVVYLFIYFFYQDNYYERKIARDAYVNEQNIRRFEDDVRNNKVLDLDSYLTVEEKDYSNKISRLGEKFNDIFGTRIIKGTAGIFNGLKKLVWG